MNTTPARRRLMSVAIVAFAAALGWTPAQSQTFQDVDPRVLENGPILLELPGSTRALALGNAYGGSDWDAIFYHPALLSGSGVGGAVQRFGAGGTHVTLAGGSEWLDGQVGFGVATLEFGAGGESPSDLLRDVGALGVPGPTGATEFMAALGYTREIVGPLQAGVVAKLIGQRLGSRRGSTGALDLGLAMDTGPVTLALSAQNLGPELDVGDEALSLARRVTLGAASDRRPLGPLDVGAAAHITRDGTGEFIPGGGLEIAWWPVVGRTFIARVGARRVVDGVGSALSFGGGFSGDRIRIDYAFQGFDGLDGAHRLGLGFR